MFGPSPKGMLFFFLCLYKDIFFKSRGLVFKNQISFLVVCTFKVIYRHMNKLHKKYCER